MALVLDERCPSIGFDLDDCAVKPVLQIIKLVVIFYDDDFLVGIISLFIGGARQSLGAHFFVFIRPLKVVHEVQEELIVLVDEQRVASRGDLHYLFHLLACLLGHVFNLSVCGVAFGQLFDLSCVVVKFLVEHIPLQVDPKLLHHALESHREVVPVVHIRSTTSPKMVQIGRAS